MMKNILFCTVCLFLLASCESDKPKLEAAESAAKPTTSKAATIDELKQESLLETDITARVGRGMDKLMKEYELAAETIEGFDNPSYTVDEKM